MKKHRYYIIIVLFMGCNHYKSTSNKVSVHANEEGLYLVEDDSSSFNKEIVADEECVFDQSTQTDDFLKGIKELEGFIWNQETKTAFIELSENESLEIVRGGCTHFGLSATFKIKNKSVTYEKEKQLIINKVLWISNLLKEFAYQDILDSFESNNYLVKNEDEDSSVIYFSDQYLIDNHYSVWIKDYATYSKIEISFYIN